MAMNGFTGNLDLRHGDLGNWSRWTLLAPLTYTGSTGAITAPEGMVTDGASIPRWLWWLLSPTGRWLAAAVIHDMGCDLVDRGTPHPLMPTRKEADRVFHEAMRSVGTNRATAWGMWAAVRLAGIFGRRG
jgi:hypothetical protein